MMKLNVKNLPVLDRDISDLETLEAELAMANKRVAQAVKRRDEIMEPLTALLKKKVIRDLEKRGIRLGETVVIVSQRSWATDDWEYKKAIVMDVIVATMYQRDEALDIFDLAIVAPEIRFEFAAVKKDGSPSKAYSGISEFATIERIA